MRLFIIENGQQKQRRNIQKTEKASHKDQCIDRCINAEEPKSYKTNTNFNHQ